MPISDHLRAVRAKVGHDLLVVPSVTGVVFDEQDRILLVRHSNRGVWGTPGGAVDPDESPVDAVVRELWEETGLHVAPTSVFGVFGGPEFRVRYENGDETAYVISAFACRRLGGTLRADGVETLEARYVAPAEFDALPLAPWARTVLPRVIADRGRAWIPPVTWFPPAEP